MNNLRTLPSIEQLLQTARAAQLIAVYGRPLTVDALRSTLAESRQRMRAGAQSMAPAAGLILEHAETHLAALLETSVQPVINATGVILHTNLGRAPLSRPAIQAMQAAAESYTNLEFDLESGKRGARSAPLQEGFRKLLNVEAVAIVNNNASAVLLILSTLAARKRVVIARSQLVEIGGGFRVPDVMKQSGAKLVEVGTTNKVRLADYTTELSGAALVMRAHRSNFKMIGFTGEPDLAGIAAAAHKAELPLVDDLGSGALLDTARFGLAHEPTVQESLAAGADLVCFSGDKLFGGPQAGIIVGRAELIERLARHPLARALRADKLCLAGLSATLQHYLKDEAEREIPVWRMIAMPAEQVRARAERWVAELGFGAVIAAQATVGGGSLPGEVLASHALALRPARPADFMRKLRDRRPPVIARTQSDRVLLDPRSVLPGQEPELLSALNSLKMELT
jgi:L-seryl-tRNA(Ser) seleniumtransferase